MGIVASYVWEDAKEKIKSLIREGRVSKIVVRNAQGDKVTEFPVTVGAAGAVAGFLMAPFLATVGYVVLTLAGCTIEIVKEDGSQETISVDSKASAGPRTSTRKRGRTRRSRWGR